MEISSDYALSYTGAGELWYNDSLTAIDFGSEYANKTVEFSMKVCGSADPERTTEGLGFIKSDKSWLGIGIEREKISTMDTWSTITGTWVLDENGKMLTSAGDYSGNCERYTIYIKDVKINKVYTENELSALAVMTSASSYISHYAIGNPINGTKISNNGFRAGCGIDDVRPSRGYMLSKAAIKSIIDLGYDTLSFTITTSPNGGVSTAEYVELWISGGAIDWLMSEPDLGSTIFMSGSRVEIDLVALYADISSSDGLGFMLRIDESTYYTAAADYLTLSDFSFGVLPANVKALAVMASANSYVSNWGVGNPINGTKLSSNSFQAGCGMDGSYTRRGYMLSKAAIKSVIDLGFDTVSFTVTTSPSGTNEAPGYIELWISGGAVDWINSTPDIGATIYASGSTVEIDLVKLYADISESNGVGFILRTDETTYYTAAADYLMLSDISVS